MSELTDRKRGGASVLARFVAEDADESLRAFENALDGTLPRNYR